jgi:hypothetical protein
LVPTFDRGDDFLGIGGPHEGLGIVVGFPEKAIDRGLEIDDRAKHAAFEAALGQLGEEALDGVEPGGRGRRVVEHKARMSAEPGSRLGMFVRAVIVEDHVNDLADRHLGLDGIQEPDELLMPVTLHAPPDHLSIEHVEGGKQGGGAVSLVIMGHRPASPRLDRQARLGAVKRLDLALFIDTEHHRVRRRVDIQPDDITQLGDEFRVARQFELPYPVRLEAMRAPDAPHRKRR